MNENVKGQRKQENIRFFSQLVNVQSRGVVNFLYDSNLATARISAGIKIVIACRKLQDRGLALDPRSD